MMLVYYCSEYNSVPIRGGGGWGSWGCSRNFILTSRGPRVLGHRGPRAERRQLVRGPAGKGATQCQGGLQRLGGDGGGAPCPPRRRPLRQWFRFVHIGGEMSTASLFSRFGRHRSSLSLFLQVQ